VIHGFREEAWMNRDRFWLTEAQFARIEPYLPRDTRGKPRVDDCRVISGIVHVLKSGGRWIDAPPDYGPRKTLYNRYVRWIPTARPSHASHPLGQFRAEGITKHPNPLLVFQQPASSDLKFWMLATKLYCSGMAMTRRGRARQRMLPHRQRSATMTGTSVDAGTQLLQNAHGWDILAKKP